jgi:nucleoid-associated protein YgaU
MRYALVMMLAALVGLSGCQKRSKDIQTTVNEPPAAPLEDLSAVPAPQPAPAATVVRPAGPALAPAAAYPTPAPAGRTYLVQPKDTLYSIARRELGNPKRWPEIAELNLGLTPENLKAGQTIKLPAR